MHSYDWLHRMDQSYVAAAPGRLEGLLGVAGFVIALLTFLWRLSEERLRIVWTATSGYGSRPHIERRSDFIRRPDIIGNLVSDPGDIHYARVQICNVARRACLLDNVGSWDEHRKPGVFGAHFQKRAVRERILRQALIGDEHEPIQIQPGDLRRLSFECHAKSPSESGVWILARNGKLTVRTWDEITRPLMPWEFLRWARLSKNFRSTHLMWWWRSGGMKGADRLWRIARRSQMARVHRKQ